jgi:hypothetical protein
MGKMARMPDFLPTRFGPPGSPRQLRQYNFRHFVPKHIFADVWRTLGGAVLPPGRRSRASTWTRRTAAGSVRDVSNPTAAPNRRHRIVDVSATRSTPGCGVATCATSRGA